MCHVGETGVTLDLCSLIKTDCTGTSPPTLHVLRPTSSVSKHEENNSPYLTWSQTYHHAFHRTSRFDPVDVAE